MKLHRDEVIAAIVGAVLGVAVVWYALDRMVAFAVERMVGR